VYRKPYPSNRRRRLDELRTGDGRPLPKHLKAQISHELDRLELLLEQIKAVETERDALLAAQQIAAPPSAAMLLAIKDIGPDFAAILWSEGFFRHFDNRRQIYDRRRDLAPRTHADPSCHRRYRSDSVSPPHS
jgi:transposase